MAANALRAQLAEFGLAANPGIANSAKLAELPAHHRHAGHLGGLGFFVRRAAEQRLIAIVIQNGPPLMALPGSTNRAIGNNPIAFGAPVPEGPPILFDISPSTAAQGKILGARVAGDSIPDD